jgi:hypothetical protein
MKVASGSLSPTLMVMSDVSPCYRALLALTPPRAIRQAKRGAPQGWRNGRLKKMRLAKL